MEDLSTGAGITIGGLLMSIVWLIRSVWSGRTDPKLIELMGKQQSSQDKIEASIDRNTEVIGKLTEGLLSEVGDVRRSNGELRTENALLKQQIDIVTKAQDAMRAEFTEKRRSDAGEIARLKSNLLETEGKLTRANEDREAMDIRVCTLETQNAELQGKVAELEKKVNEFTALFEKERARADAAEQHNKRLLAQLAEKEALLAERDAEIDRLREVNAELMQRKKSGAHYPPFDRTKEENDDDGKLTERPGDSVPAGGGGDGSGGEVRDESGAEETV